MGKFSFSWATECDRCGNTLSSSDETCSFCVDKPKRRWHFERVGTHEIVVVWAINPIRAWDALHDEVDDVLPWTLLEVGENSIGFYQMGRDVRDRDKLKMGA